MSFQNQTLTLVLIGGGVDSVQDFKIFSRHFLPCCCKVSCLRFLSSFEFSAFLLCFQFLAWLSSWLQDSVPLRGELLEPGRRQLGPRRSSKELHVLRLNNEKNMSNLVLTFAIKLSVFWQLKMLKKCK